MAGSSPKPHRITEREAWNEMVRERKTELWNKGWELMNATKTIVSGQGDDTFAEQVPDWAVQIRAYIDFMDRFLGKATDKLEVTGEDGGPIRTEGSLDIADPKLRDLAHELLKRQVDG